MFSFMIEIDILGFLGGAFLLIKDSILIAIDKP